MKFWDREKEKEELKAYLKSEPNAILFVYGPKSSGKSTLLNKVASELPEDDFAYYWYDLREEAIYGYDSVLRIFFKEKGWARKLLDGLLGMVKVNLQVFELSVQELKRVMSGKENPFAQMRQQLVKVAEDGKTPVIVFDELQKLKDVYINLNGNGTNQRPLVKELFNFFVRLTKVLHLSHVIVMSSDTFFIEEVYSDSTLKNTPEFYLVDFFDDETAIKILTDEGFDEDVAKEVISEIGGVPWMMERVLSNGNPLKKVEDLYKQSKARILGYLDEKKINGEDIEITKEVFKKVLSGKTLETQDELLELRKLFEAEILFYDPINRIIKFQTRLDEIAAKEILGRGT